MELKPPTVRVIKRLLGSGRLKDQLDARRQQRFREVVGDGFTQRTGKRYTVVKPTGVTDSARVGIYLRGGCDLPAVFTASQLIRNAPKATYAIVRDSNLVSGSRSDFILQTLRDWDPEARRSMREVIERLSLRRNYFAPVIFDPTFELPGAPREGKFPKSVLVLSAAPDYSRSLYEHRQHGYLVDPGGFWLNTDMAGVLGDNATLKWFTSNFRQRGRMTSDEFRVSFGALLTEVERHLGCHVLVFNLLTVDPSDRTHSYGFTKQADTARRREFTVALAELSAEHRFQVVDVDRILKLNGVGEMVDFAHFSEDQFLPIGTEVHRILGELELV